jgi:hypothetical protein
MSHRRRLFTALAVAWLLCGVVSTGFHYAYFDCEFVYSEDFKPRQKRHRELLGKSIAFIPAGPVGLFVELTMSGFAMHGWRLWPSRAGDCYTAIR